MRSMRRFGCALVLLMSAASGAALSQQPGTSGYNSVYLPAHGVGDTARTRWEDRWGAYARGETDPRDGVATSGAAFNLRSRKEAEDAALNVCAGRGGLRCAIVSASKNDCFVVGSGDIGGYWQTHSTIGKAKSAVLKKCGRNCQILWEGCSVPVQQ